MTECASANVQRRDGVVSFNLEPLAHDLFREYPITPQQRVVLRSDLTASNAKMVDMIAAEIGSGPFRVEKLGIRKHCVTSDNGIKAWVPALFLKPE